MQPQDYRNGTADHERKAVKKAVVLGVIAMLPPGEQDRLAAESKKVVMRSNSEPDIAKIVSKAMKYSWTDGVRERRLVAYCTSPSPGISDPPLCRV